MSENSQLRSPMRPDKKNVSAATKQKQKLAIAVIVLLVPFSFCIYLILAPRSEPQDDGLGGVNATMPDGKRVPMRERKLGRSSKPRRSAGKTNGYKKWPHLRFRCCPTTRPSRRNPFGAVIVKASALTWMLLGK